MLSRVYSWLQVENWSMTLFFYIYTENTNSISTKCLTNYIYIYMYIKKRKKDIFIQTKGQRSSQRGGGPRDGITSHWWRSLYSGMACQPMIG